MPEFAYVSLSLGMTSHPTVLGSHAPPQVDEHDSATVMGLAIVQLSWTQARSASAVHVMVCESRRHEDG